MVRKLPIMLSIPKMVKTCPAHIVWKSPGNKDVNCSPITFLTSRARIRFRMDYPSKQKE